MAKPPYKGEITDWSYVPGGALYGFHRQSQKNIRTSRVTSIYAEGDQVMCETQNSTYRLMVLMPTVEQMQQRGLVSE